MLLTNLTWLLILSVLTIFVALFKDYSFSFREWFLPAFGTSLIIAAAVLFVPGENVRIAIALSFAAVVWWLRSRRVDGDAIEGMLTGSLAGGGASMLITASQRPANYGMFALVTAGAVSGLLAYAFALRLRRGRFAAAVVSAAVVFLFLPLLTDVDESRQAMSTLVGTIIIVALIATIFRWPVILRELREEAQLGVIPIDPVRWAANPFKRFLGQHWADQRARREFVRLATDLAVRKSRQRRMNSDAARLHQLEVLRIRRILQEVYSVELSMRKGPAEPIEAAKLSPRSSATLRQMPDAHRPDAKG
jgi:hypothetical protein